MALVECGLLISIFSGELYCCIRGGTPGWPMFSGDGKITEPLCMFNVSSPICHY